MLTRPLGPSDLHISPLGIGAWAMGGGGWAFAWGPQDDRDSIAAIHAAAGAGLNWIDTAAVYGLGHSEEVVGRALRGLSPRPYVFTKCELVWNERGEITQCLQAASIRRECEASLRRLGVEVIDLYQVHWPLPDPDLEEGWTELARLQKEGKARWIGVSNCSASQLERVRRIAPVTSLQPPYSLVARGIEPETLPYARQHGIGVIVYSPMKHGLLSGAMTRERIAALPPDDHRARRAEFQEPALTRILGLVEKLRDVGRRHGRTPGEVAIAWTLRRPEVAGAIVGLRSPAQLQGVIGAAEWRLSPEEIAEIESAPDG